VNCLLRGHYSSVSAPTGTCVNPLGLSSPSVCSLVRGVCAGSYQPLLPPGLSRRYLCESFLRYQGPYPGGPSECLCLFLPPSHRPSPSSEWGRLPACAVKRFHDGTSLETATIPLCSGLRVCSPPRSFPPQKLITPGRPRLLSEPNMLRFLRMHRILLPSEYRQLMVWGLPPHKIHNLVGCSQMWTYSPQKRQAGSAFALMYRLLRRSCTLIRVFVIPPVPSVLLESLPSSRAPLLHGHYAASQLTMCPSATLSSSTVFLVWPVIRLPCFRHLSWRDEEGFSSCLICPCYRAVPTTPPKWHVASVSPRHVMLPSPRTRGLGLRTFSFFSRPLWVHFRCWDRTQARRCEGEGLPVSPFRLRDGVTISPTPRFPRPPDNPGRPSFSGPVRNLGFPPWVFPAE